MPRGDDFPGMNPLFPLIVNDRISLAESEVDISAIRSQGAGGQNVNKVSSAVHLRFDIPESSLPDSVKERLLALSDRRISSDGILVLKAQKFRTRDKNLVDAIERLGEILNAACVERKIRRATKPTKSSKVKRVETKVKKGQLKILRGKIPLE